MTVVKMDVKTNGVCKKTRAIDRSVGGSRGDDEAFRTSWAVGTWGTWTMRWLKSEGLTTVVCEKGQAKMEKGNPADDRRRVV
jgi:hypothetical protein